MSSPKEERAAASEPAGALQHAPQALKQTYGYECRGCGELWDGHQVPCDIEVALRSMRANDTCFRCGSRKVFSVMPWRYEQLKVERRNAPTASNGSPSASEASGK